MANETILQQVKNQIEELTGKKAADLETIQKMQTAASAKLTEAKQAMSDATAAMDIDAYEEARKAGQKAQNAIEMYSGKFDQIEKQEYMTEEESDRIIDSLLAYEDQLAEDFKAAIVKPLQILDKLQREYLAEVRSTENTIKLWTDTIHANYRNAGTIYGDTGTNRAPRPVPVHSIPYTGCSEAHRMKEYLDKDRELLEA